MTVTSMPQPALPAQQAEQPAEDVILGVDTHKDVHAAAVITVLGVLLAHQGFPTTAAGYRQLLAWARSFGILHRAGVECTGSYGTALARFLHRENTTHRLTTVMDNGAPKAVPDDGSGHDGTGRPASAARGRCPGVR
ncbi:IS110 family transposase [Streptomyces sp. KR55]|uniref:IS110 family transposase n=1 Tax=Streptomyces sp. KR55 TaxID=3457425 RepID=UPI003FD27301